MNLTYFGLFKLFCLRKTKNEIAELCQGVHYVDLGESFQTHIFFANFGFDTAENEPFKVRELDS